MCNGDLDEAAGAAVAAACSRDAYFLGYKIYVLSDNRLRCAASTFLGDPACGTPQAANSETAIETHRLNNLPASSANASGLERIPRSQVPRRDALGSIGH